MIITYCAINTSYLGIFRIIRSKKKKKDTVISNYSQLVVRIFIRLKLIELF